MTLAFTTIGVDVSKDWFDIFDNRDGQHSRLPMTASALARFARGAQGCLTVFEASGGYDRPLALALERAGHPYVRVNPRQAREFARAAGRLAKTDRVDAAMLAQMGQALALQPRPVIGAARRRLAALLARRDDIVAMIGAERNRTGQTEGRWIRRQISAHLRLLSRHRQAVEREVAELIATDAGLATQAKLLQSSVGVGPHTAAVLLAYLPELGQLDRRRIASLAGLAPHARDSGTFRGRRRIWGGRPQLRRALFIAALAASRYDLGFAAFRQRLEAAGKSKKTALIAVARKLITVLNAMMRKGQTYKKQTA